MVEDIESVPMGVTPCDDRRVEREADLKSIQKALNEKLLEETHILFGDVYDLLKEAMSCYQNGAYLATAMVCRTAVESAIYIAISRELHITKLDFLQAEQVSIDYQHRDAKRRAMLEFARKKKLLDRKSESQAWRVFELGDFGAHFGQRLDKEIFGKETKHTKPDRFWVTRREALRALKDTACLLQSFMSKVGITRYAHSEHPG